MNSRQPPYRTARPGTEGQASESPVREAVRCRGTDLRAEATARRWDERPLLGPWRMGDRPFQRCLVGGTFDRFHAGHRLLLKTAQRQAQCVEIHVVDDAMADQKAPNIQSLDERMRVLQGFIDAQSMNASLHELSDVHGPAPTHPTADAIVATPETEGQCHLINERRVEAGLPPLEVLLVEHALTMAGDWLSSSLIRRGSVDTEGHPWFEAAWSNRTLRMTGALDSELKTPMGVLYEGPEAAPDVALSRALEEMDLSHAPLVAVGDVTVQTFLQMGVTPDLALIDGQTKRTPLASEDCVDPSPFAHRQQVVNPPGVLTPALKEALSAAFSTSESSLIVVEGEEDLAPLFAHLLAPLGAVVVYGQPGRGAVVQVTSLQVKERCRSLLVLFEVV